MRRLLATLCVVVLVFVVVESRPRKHRNKKNKRLHSKDKILRQLRNDTFIAETPPGDGVVLNNSVDYVSYNPLKDQPNLSRKNKKKNNHKQIIGSRKALSVTKLDYLKEETCKTKLLKQVIREEGCLRRTIVNKFCYGQCNSFYIPKMNRNDLRSSAFKSCSFCRPKKHAWVTITLRCPGSSVKFKRKRIQKIKSCKCMAVKIQDDSES